MALTERLSLYLSPEAKRRVLQEVSRRRARGEEFGTANQTSVIEELILTDLPPADPEGPGENTPRPRSRRRQAE
jgi:hypothetical protein